MTDLAVSRPQANWRMGTPGDAYDPAAEATTLAHRSFRPFTGVIVGFHAPEQYGLGWALIRPSVPWELPGSFLVPRLDQVGTPTAERERVIAAVCRPSNLLNPAMELVRGTSVVVSPFPGHRWTVNAVAIGPSLPTGSQPFGDQRIGADPQEHGSAGKELSGGYVFYKSSDDNGTYQRLSADTQFVEFINSMLYGTALDKSNAYYNKRPPQPVVVRFVGPDPKNGKTIYRYHVLDEAAASDVALSALAEYDRPEQVLRWVSTPAVLRPFYQYSVLAADRTPIERLEFSFDRTLPLQGHVGFEQLPVSRISFPSPIPFYRGVNIRVELGTTGLTALGVWAGGPPLSIASSDTPTRVDHLLVDKYPCPFVDRFGRCTGALVGIAPRVFDRARLFVTSDAGGG